ncbi:hypothetical protein MTR_1g095085 [Medicago truncatula]|uniref:Uncharacterized protein n=1 Tax=Medicago truncatula TaxID=3880 RepID=A0A072VNY8_MEDTR|nr:hypothetical protein MTR_1g095085 [Medicago truncatula]
MADQFHVIRLGVKITVLKVHSKPEIQSQIFYVFWDARILLEDYASQRDRLHFQSSSFGYTISHLDVPIIM